jgi:hypothetical protein
MRSFAPALTLVAVALLAAPAAGQDDASTMETVVVTGTEYAALDPTMTPHLFLLRRADHVITKVRVVCDTRDLSKRRQELKETLRSMIRDAAKTGTISLGVGNEIVADLTERTLDKVIQPDAKQDTSVAVVVIKTRVTNTDLFDDATGRIERFIETTPKVGRTEVLREKDWDLTIVGPEQYRATIIAKVAEDAKKTAAAFGPAYAVTVTGLQHPVAWYQKGPLDLALYIPYVMAIAPPAAK